MRKLHLFILGALVTSGLTACMKEEDVSLEQYNRNDAEIQTYVSQNSDVSGGKTTSSGLYYVITSAKPTSKSAAIGEEVEFTYLSRNMLTGVKIDSTVPGFPTYYPLGIGSILPGLEEGLALMREGEKATFLVPSYLAYGSETKPNLPGYSVVRFDVTLNRSRSETQQINEYIAAQKLTNVDSTSSGLRFVRTTPPSNQTIAAGRTLAIKYAGRQLRANSAFDSTGTGTFDVTLGQGRFVKGFEEGLSKMGIGDKATIIFPSSLGYGARGVPENGRYVITPYAPLRFDLEVVSAK